MSIKNLWIRSHPDWMASPMCTLLKELTDNAVCEDTCALWSLEGCRFVFVKVELLTEIRFKFHRVEHIPSPLIHCRLKLT